MKRLCRSEKNKKIAGICGGLSEMFEVDPTLIRLAMALLAIMSGILPFVVVYVIGWYIIPKESELKETKK